MATNKAPFKRYTEGSRVFYDVLASKGTFYYTVEMLGPVAISCECTGNAQFKRHCHHMGDAEKTEVIVQTQQNSVKIPRGNSVESETAKGTLNGDRAFSLLKR